MLISRHKGFDDDFGSEPTSTAAPVAATPTPLYKGFADFSGIILKCLYPDDDTPDHSRPPKKTQLEAEADKFKANQGFNVSRAF